MNGPKLMRIVSLQVTTVKKETQKNMIALTKRIFHRIGNQYQIRIVLKSVEPSRIIFTKTKPDTCDTSKKFIYTISCGCGGLYVEETVRSSNKGTHNSDSKIGDIRIE